MIRPHYVPLFQSVCHSEKLADLKDHGARFFYTLLLTHCDGWGRVTARPRVLFSKVWAMYGGPDDVGTYLDALERVGLIRRYTVEGEPFLCIPDWELKAGKVGQATRRAESAIPAPPEPDATPRKGSRTPRKASQGVDEGSQGLAHARAGAQLGSATSTSRLGSDGEGDAGEDPPPKVEIEAWAKTFAEFPALDVPDVRSAYRDLLAMRKRKRFGEWEPETLRKHLAHAVPFGPKALAEAFRESDRSEYRGVFPSKHAGNGAAKRANGEPTFGDLLDAARAKGASV